MWPPPLLCTPQAMDMLPGARFCHRPPGSARLTLSPVTPRPSLLLRARVCGRGRSTGQLLGTGRALLTRLSSAPLGASSSQQRPHCHLQLTELCWTHPLQRVPLGHRHQRHSAWHPQPTSHSTWLSVPLPLRGEGQILPLQLARPGPAWPADSCPRGQVSQVLLAAQTSALLCLLPGMRQSHLISLGSQCPGGCPSIPPNSVQGRRREPRAQALERWAQATRSSHRSSLSPRRQAEGSHRVASGQCRAPRL